jgi:uncharacterized membrane protein YphA (DoxX/SURF4 family)
MRLVIGGALVYRASFLLISHPPALLATASGLLIGAGILLLAGLWTPIAGTIVALIELWKIFAAAPNDTWAYLFAATLAAALAMIGPGAWSLDARLFGWKRIDPQVR